MLLSETLQPKLAIIHCGPWCCKTCYRAIFTYLLVFILQISAVVLRKHNKMSHSLYRDYLNVTHMNVTTPNILQHLDISIDVSTLTQTH